MIYQIRLLHKWFIIIFIYLLLLLHICISDICATAVDIMGGPVVTKY